MPWNRQSLWIVAQYHLRETALRWKAQPASPLARWFLTFALAALAGVLLLGFAAAEAARRSELRRLGLDTVVVQAPAVTPLGETGALPPDHWARPLGARGELVFLQQLAEPAFTPWEEPMPVLAGSFATLAALRRAAGDKSPAALDGLWLTRDLPAGRRAQLRQQGMPLSVLTALPSGPWEALGLENCAVVAAPAAEGASARGRLDILLFTPAASGNDDPPLHSPGSIIASIRRLYAADGESAPVLRDPSPYRLELELFTRAQDRWRRGLALLLAGCVLLVFVSLGMLEEKQTRYTQALLRSLGVPGAALLGFAALENLLLANTALVAAIAASRGAAQLVLTLAGAGPANGLGYDPAVLALLGIAINLGAMLSLIPLALALRRPIGVVLA